ncbi:hypothetical protein [Naumannella cuiyingiana]|uniref:DUF2567 domain-containing protein n=1 Tax=Naumannella cuiyingiana TaxID=1347891 RepID=A0A7Z0IJJ5_9ACTN|nr:hypothetical protein [Naumannella cuiyingiana]NYI69605.1 hypothetical protein [Naumannella cuiyingiana]
MVFQQPAGGRQAPEGHETRPAAEQPDVRYVGDAVTTGSIPVITDDMATPPELRPAFSATRIARWAAIWFALCAATGALAGALWFAVVALPGYQIAPDGAATTTERGLASYYASDAWFVVIGLVLSLALGVICWRWLSELGWPVAVLAALGALAAGLVCWLVGWLLGPGDFESRIAMAQPGDVVAVALTVRGSAALLAWPLAGVLPVLLWSSLAPDHEEPTPLRLPWRRR